MKKSMNEEGGITGKISMGDVQGVCNTTKNIGKRCFPGRQIIAILIGKRYAGEIGKLVKDGAVYTLLRDVSTSKGVVLAKRSLRER